jgi:hypothetical protein
MAAYLEQRITLLTERLLNRELLELSGEGIVVTNQSGVLTRTNSKARELLQISEDKYSWGQLRQYGADERSALMLSKPDTGDIAAIRLGNPQGGIGNPVFVAHHNLSRNVQ